ncbi:diguanylate cyclase domain-containing protein [Litoribacillus peritrichatus]|uniref:Diguanylate cyclase n=1 Tax=Litoribacillus peritrichatus TaxID=718191 RepID=A0ABP7LYW2_9GAMM
MQKHTDYQGLYRSKAVPVYPVILFVVAFLYLVGVMSWQVWKDHQYHIQLSSNTIKNRVVLFHDYFRSQLQPLKQLLAHDYAQPFSDLAEVDDFYLKAVDASALVTSVALVDGDSTVLKDSGVPLSRNLGEPSVTKFRFDARSPISGLRVLNTEQGYLFHRRKDNQGFLVIVFSLAGFKTSLATNEFPLAAYELVDTSTDKQLWVSSSVANKALESRDHVWSVRLLGSELELSGYINHAAMSSHYFSTLTPSALVAFFYLFGGVSLIWYLSTARKENKSLMQKNRELALRGDLILSSISDAVLVIGQNETIHYANHAFYSLLKLTKERDVNEDLKDHREWAAVEKLIQWTDALLKQETPETDEVISIDNLAVTRFVEPTYQIISLEDSSRVVVWVLKDVSEQHRIHDELTTSQSHYKSTFEGAGVALAMMDLNELGDWLENSNIKSIEAFHEWRDRNNWQFQPMADGVLLTEINESACRMLDTIDSMTAVKHLKKSLLHSESKLWSVLLNLILSKKDRAETVMEIKSVTGRLLCLQLNVSFVQGLALEEGGHSEAARANALSSKNLLLSLLDITALKEAKEYADLREKFWQQVVHTVPDIVYVNDVTTRLNVFVNHEIGEQLGYSAAEVAELGDSYWKKLMHPDDKRIFKHEMPQLRQMANGAVKETVLRLQHKNGDWRSYLFSDTPFTRQPDGSVERYIGVGRDITELLQAQSKAGQQARYLEILADNIRDLVWVMDPKFHFKYISPSVIRVLGYSQQEVLNQGIRAFLADDQFARIEREIAVPLQAVMDGKVDAKQYREDTGEHIVDVMALHSDGHYVSLEIKIALLWDENHNFEGLLGSCRDITQRRKSQAELKLAAEVFESSNEAILITDMDGDIVRSNHAFQKVSGYNTKELIGKNIATLCTEQQTEQFYHTLLGLVADSGYWQGEVWHRKKTGEPYPAWVGVSSIRNDDQLVDSYIVIFSDMSERKEAEERIHRLAYYDPLTDLANRSLFREQLQLEMRHADQNEGAVVLLYLDLDNFKPVNDTLGHEAGDILLKEVAQRLSSCVRGSDTVARMGGDEFTIILGGQSTEASARSFGEHVAGQVVSALQEPVLINGQEFIVTASVGVAIYPKHAEDASALLRNADHAMYKAKESGRDLYSFYTKETD